MKRSRHAANRSTLPWLVVVCALSLSLNLPAALSPVITIDGARPGHTIPATLWGIFFEDINMSTDGGIYPERVRNRSFEDAEQPAHWQIGFNAEGKGAATVDSSNPLNPLNRRSLKLTVNGRLTLTNHGYYGMAFAKGEEYRVRLATRSNGFKGTLRVQLENAEADSLASVQIQGIKPEWSYGVEKLVATGTATKGKLVMTLEGSGTVWLDMVSILPTKTWKDHGLRPDLAEMLAALKPAFLRFPGGCWVEGENMARMYNWKKTIGDIAHREPLWNIWAYHATHGLGYHEYLQLCEDLKAEPMFCINGGMSHRETVPLDQMGPWIQDALDAIEYANGPTNTVWGGLRAKNGHPGPFSMKFLEIGNENGGRDYHERWALFHDAIKAKYPDIQLIANVWGGWPRQPKPDILDEHFYNNPDFFIRHASHYDDYDRRGPKIFVGEYAVTSGSGLGNLRGAIGEAAFMTGLERNSDVVIMAAYAPLLVNVEHKRWPINLINFDNTRAFGIPSYYVQKLFAENRGDVLLPTTVEAGMVDSAQGGSVGVGTWLTEAEFKDIKVTRNGETLYLCDLERGLGEWKRFGAGDWKVQNGVLRQSSGKENVRALIRDQSWTDYTYSLKARKISGAEGFLILFNAGADDARTWWNLGGWGNKRHGVEIGSTLDAKSGSIETGRWYDIRIEVAGSRVRCFLDGQLVHDIVQPPIKALHASTTRDGNGDVIVKIVNAAAMELRPQIQLHGLKPSGTGIVTLLTSDRSTDENSLESPLKVAPTVRPIDVTESTFSYPAPPNSFSVLRLGMR